MDTFIKAVAGTLIALVIYLILAKQEKDISILLTITVCCILTSCAVSYLKPVLEFLNRLQSVSKLDPQMLTLVLRAVGIGFLSEITSTICSDAGNSSLGKILQLVSTCVILWLSLPLFTKLIDLIEGMLLNI